MALDKRTWVNIAAGTVAIVAIVFGAKQCSDKQDACDEAQEWRKIVNDNTAAMNDATGTINDLRACLEDSIAEIAEKDTLVLQLRDSLNACREKLAKDCVPCNQKKKATAKKAPAKKAPAKKVCATPVASVAESVCDQAATVFVAPDTVRVRGNSARSDQIVVVNGDNSGTIIVNSNGNVNGNNIANINSDDAQKCEQFHSVRASVVVKRRIRCR